MTEMPSGRPSEPRTGPAAPGTRLRDRAEQAERQRDEALAAVERVRKLATPSPGADPWYVSAPAVRAALDQPKETR